MKRYKTLGNKFIGTLQGFLPSKYSFLAFILFFTFGLVFSILKPQYAASSFYYGFFLGNIEAKIQLPEIFSLNYFLNQFIYYLGNVSFKIFLNNVTIAFLCIFTGIAIVPIILIDLFAFSGSLTGVLIGKFGILKAVLILLGSFHLYFEILAALLVIDAFLKFYGSFVNAIRSRSTHKFKKDILNDFLPLILKIIIVLAVAALLEVFWSTWWVYILTNHYISWHDFYFGAYSVLVH